MRSVTEVAGWRPQPWGRHASVVLQIRLLGPVEAVDATGLDVPVGGPQARAVLAILALAAPRGCPLERIVDGLWGEDPPASARNAVQVRVTGLRKALSGAGVDLARIGDGYVLRGPVWVDVAHFERLVRQGRAALRGGEVARARDDLVEAVALWRGAALEGMPAALTESWVPGLEQTRCAALADLAQAHVRAGELAEAVVSAQQLLALQRYDERGWVALAAAQYWSGQQDQALQTCRRARQTLAEDLGLDPTAALRQLEAQILTHEVPGGPATERDDSEPDAGQPQLPALPFAFAGRDTEVADLLERRRAGQRLITLVGIGGIGKTSLAVSLAHREADAGTRVAMCALATDADATAVLVRACRALGIDPGDDPAGALQGSAPHAMLVLDNAEQIPDLGAALDALLGSCPELAAVVTSRRPTGARMEHVVAVAPLGEQAARGIFVAHADRVRPGAAAGQAGAVRELCEMLDGIPLALELAAGRIRSLTPQQLLDRVQAQRISVLDGWSGVALPERQASLNTVLTESHAALPPDSARLLELLGSFEGWVSLELLEAVAGDLVDDAAEALDGLVACGLVVLDVEGRIRLQGPIRQFARALGDRAALDARVVDRAVTLAEESAAGLFGAQAAPIMAALTRDRDTLAVALNRAIATGEVAAAAALVLSLNRFWLLSGMITEGRAWIDRVAAMVGHDVETTARVEVLAGTYASYQNDPAAVGVLESALARARALDLAIDRLLVNGWCCLAALAAHRGDLDTAQHAVTEAAADAAASGEESLIALARDVAGHVAAYAGDHATSLAAALSGLADARKQGDTYDVLSLLTNAAIALTYLGRMDEGLAYADEAFDLAGSIEPGPMLVSVLLARGVALASAGRPEAARIDLLEALRIAHTRHPDPLMAGDLVGALGACAAQDPSDDLLAARCFGAADALYTAQDLPSNDRLPAPLLDLMTATRTRLGEQRYRSMAALGASDPMHTIRRLLGTDEDPGR
jgi:predicted ATPase/DNA-binding SARP family transcriptional activator